jgi:septum formation protein
MPLHQLGGLLEASSKTLVLASKSPRRQELLRQIVQDFRVCVSSFPENLPRTDPASYAEATAEAKGQDIFRQVGGRDVIVLSADTVVEGEPGQIWEKPLDAAHAREMLMSLSGRSHSVHTGVALITDAAVESFTVTTTVHFVKLDEADVDQYIASGACQDKAVGIERDRRKLACAYPLESHTHSRCARSFVRQGAYGIQDAWMVDRIEGDYFAVVGLPVSRVATSIKQLLLQ